MTSPSLRASLIAATIIVAAPLAGAEERYAPPLRYGDPPPVTPRSELERRIEALVRELSTSERRTLPRADPRLERVVTELARLDESQGGPTNDVVEAAMRLHGVVEPPPHLIVASASLGADKELLDELRTQIPHALSAGRFSRQAAAVVEKGDRWRVIIALQESFIELEPVPRSMPSGGPTPLKGHLLGAFEHPAAFVTTPDGHTDPLPLGGDAHRFVGTFHCSPARGRYQIELTGEDRFGSTVLANFPVYCGVPAPSTLVVTKLAPDTAVNNAASAESTALALLNADRVHAGLRPLVPDSRLAEVARAHCRDMLEHGFVGHVSPTTGNAADRVGRAKIAAALVLENVARASTPGEVERGLMASPGHRRNIMSAEATKVGIGAVLSAPMEGARELLVTQLFIAEEAPFHAASADELRVRLQEQRRLRGFAPFMVDPALDQIADGVARDLAAGRVTPQSVKPRLDRSLAGLGARYQSVRSLFAIAPQITQLVDSMKDAISAAGRPPGIGVGLAAGPTDSDGHMAHHAVLIVALPR